MKRSKRYRRLATTVASVASYTLDAAVQRLKETASAKFDETVELAVRLGVDPRKADQMVRGTVTLPHGTGKPVRVLVLTKGVKEKEAQEAGADYVGFDEYIKKIQEGWFDFDVLIATPDVMAEVGRLGKLLGPRGLMPNPKTGTVTMDVAKAVRDVKAGKIEFRVDKTGIIHVAIGKASFDEQKLKENIKAFMETVLRLKPPSAKGQYLRSVYVSNTMGPGIAVDRVALMNELRG